MCGITGYISDRQFDSDAMLNSIAHRGPDDAGSLKKNVSGKNIFMGHRRLSIVDLSSAGHQPMSSPQGHVHLIYNGEVYNFKELRKTHLSGITFKSETDTEVILHLYLTYGMDFVKYLNGDFAMALLDEKKGKFFLIRDRVGVKPLYFTHHADSLLFASEIKTILKSGLNFELDAEQLENYFVFKYQPENDTLIKNIKRVPPGRFLELDIKTGVLKSFTYWELTKNKDLENVSYTDAVAHLQNLFTDAVEMQLMSDVPIGTFFSGGVDSSIIANLLRGEKQITHYTARKSKDDLKKEGSSSDFDFAMQLGKKWGLNLIPVDIGSDQANMELIKKTLYYSDDLIADGSQIPSYLITRQAKQKSTVMLSGMGADELFYGYPGHQISLISNYLNSLPGTLANGISHFFAGLNVGKGHFKPYKRFLQKLGKYNHLGSMRFGLLNIVGDYENAVSVLKSPGRSSELIFKKYFNASDNAFESITRFEFNNFLIKNLHYVDRMCMANGVEGRVPFLDYRLVEFAFSMPRSYKISASGTGKRILKDAFKDVLPPEIIRRRKAGFGMPFRSIFSDAEKVKSLLNMDFFGDLGMFDMQNIQTIVSNHQSGRDDNSALIYALISFQEWYKLFLN